MAGDEHADDAFPARAERILARIRRVPAGHVATYGDIDRRAPRLVGRVLHDAGAEVPWHRIVRADGADPGRGHRRRLTGATGRAT